MCPPRRPIPSLLFLSCRGTHPHKELKSITTWLSPIPKNETLHGLFIINVQHTLKWVANYSWYSQYIKNNALQIEFPKVIIFCEAFLFFPSLGLTLIVLESFRQQEWALTQSGLSSGTHTATQSETALDQSREPLIENPSVTAASSAWSAHYLPTSLHLHTRLLMSILLSAVCPQTSRHPHARPSWLMSILLSAHYPPTSLCLHTRLWMSILLSAHSHSYLQYPPPVHNKGHHSNALMTQFLKRFTNVFLSGMSISKKKKKSKSTHTPEFFDLWPLSIAHC